MVSGGVKEKQPTKRRVEGNRELAPGTIEVPGLIDDEVEGGRVVSELHYVLTKIDDYSPFVDNLVDAANDYGGPDYRRNIELLDGRGVFSAEEIVSGVVLAVAAAEKMLSPDEEERVIAGNLPETNQHYLDELHERFGVGDKMKAIKSRLDHLSKNDIREFLDFVREGRKHPATAVYDILSGRN